jgi:RNA polymerase sigma-70 factor (ECF subfamily)
MLPASHSDPDGQFEQSHARSEMNATYSKSATKGDLLNDERQDVLRLLIEHRNSLFGFIFAAMRDYDAAEEVLQEVSVAICESSGDFRLGTNFGAWAREIARRRVLAYWRQRDSRPALLSDEALQNVSEGFRQEEEVASPQERRRALRLCLERLQPFVRKLIEQRYACKRSLGELATELEQNPESIRKAIYRGRLALRKCIEYRLAEQGVNE